MAGPFFGKYRGRVVENVDPLELGRLRIEAPLVLGTVTSAWAMPCVPYAGPGVGWYVLPPVDASIWVEFEGGDPDYPVWSGCFWAEGQLPAKPAAPTTRMLKTEAATLEFNDLEGEGGFTLSIGSPALAMPITIRGGSNGLTITIAETELALSETGLTLTAEPGRAEIGQRGVQLSHGTATIRAMEPEVSLNGSALTVI